MARVTKPCPECGGTDSIRDTPTSICRRCKGLIAFAKQRQEDDAKKNGEEVLVRTVERSYALPGYYPKIGASPDHATRERLEKALHTAIMVQTRPAGIGRYPNGQSIEGSVDVPKHSKADRREWSIYVYMRKDQAEAMIELEDALRQFIMEGAEASYEAGKNLLLNIAAGKLSLEEINQKHIKKG